MYRILFVILMVLILESPLISLSLTEIEDYGFGACADRHFLFLYDIDNDNLLDLIQNDINLNVLHFEQNDNDPEFFEILEQSSSININLFNPTICDIDNNNLLDIFDSSGNYIKRYEQISQGSYDFELVDENFSTLYMNDNYYLTTPTFCDINGNNLLDMFALVSHYNVQWGYYDYFTFHHYEQIGENSIIFDLINNNFLGEIWNEYGCPKFDDFDIDSKIDMFISRSGCIAHYEQTDTNSYNFDLITNYFNDIYVGDYYFSILDIDSNNLIDLIYTKGSNMLSRFEQEYSNSYNIVESNKIITNIIDVGDRSFPAIFDIDGNGLLDLIIGNGEYVVEYYTGDVALYHYEQTDIGSFEFDYITNQFANLNDSTFYKPNIYDIDNDGLLDMIVGNTNDLTTHYEQSSPNSYDFDLVSTNFSNICLGYYSTLTFADINNDNLLDLIVGDYNGQLSHYEQSPDNPYNFILCTNNFNNIDVGLVAAPFICDIDSNNLMDLFIGCASGIIFHFEQISFSSLEFQIIDQQLNDIDIGSYSVPFFCDIDQNGNKDLLIGSKGGGVSLYSNDSTAIEEINTIPNSENLFQNYPNPFNPDTTISFGLPDDSRVEITIYNIKGQKVKTLINEEMQKGKHSIIWSGVDESGNTVSSGVYLYKLKVKGKTKAMKKCLLLK